MGARSVTDPRRRLGQFGETAVSKWYEQRGGTVADRNWRVREGEIDLVVVERGAVVIVEVKTRRSARYGMPIEAITPAKRARLRSLAVLWARAHPELRRPALRIEIASVVVDAAGSAHIAVTPLD